MKNLLYLGALALVLSLPAQATLIGDDVTGSASGLTTFNSGTVTVDGTFVPEFYGTIIAAGDKHFDVSFDIHTDTIDMYIERTNGSGTVTIPGFSVTFSDLDWVGQPTYILSGVSLLLDTPTDILGGTPGDGLDAIVADHSLTLNFASFEIPEFREIVLQLESAEGGGGTGTPIPEPSTMLLLSTGLCGLIARRRIA